jgi:hypothetical protein
VGKEAARGPSPAERQIARNQNESVVLERGTRRLSGELTIGGKRVSTG